MTHRRSVKVIVTGYSPPCASVSHHRVPHRLGGARPDHRVACAASAGSVEHWSRAAALHPGFALDSSLGSRASADLATVVRRAQQGPTGRIRTLTGPPASPGAAPSPTDHSGLRWAA